MEASEDEDFVLGRNAGELCAVLITEGIFELNLLPVVMGNTVDPGLFDEVDARDTDTFLDF